MGYFISRQSYVIDGTRVVEVESNGLDYSGPDMLTCKYDGEGEEYANPVEAIEAAIKIRDAWNADLEESGRIGDDEGDAAVIAFGTTGGILSGICPDGSSDEELLSRARKILEGLPKCDRCGELLPKKYWYLPDDPDFGKFCREYCLEESVSEMEEEFEDEEESEEDDEDK